MPIRDVAGILRPGMFEDHPLSESDATLRTVSGRGAYHNVTAQGPDALSQEPFRISTSNPMRNQFRADQAGAVRSPSSPDAFCIAHVPALLKPRRNK